LLFNTFREHKNTEVSYMPESATEAPSRVRRSLLPILLLVFATGLSFAFTCLPLPLAGGALAGAGFMVLSVRRPVWGLVALSAMLTLEGIATGGSGISETRLVGAAAFGAWVIHMVLYGKSLRVNSTFSFACIFLLWAGLSFLWAHDPLWAAPYYLTLVQLVLLFLLTVNVIEDEKDFRLILAALLLGAVVTGILSIKIFITNPLERARTFEAQNANEYAAIVGLALIGGLYLAAVLKKRSMRILSALGACCLVFPLILAQSRTAWLATLAAVGVFLWHTEKRVRNFLAVAASGAVVVIVLFAAGLISFTVVDRAAELIAMRSSKSSRLDVWRVASRVIYDHPLAGTGFMQFPLVYNSYRSGTAGIRKDTESTRDAHSVYFGITADLGVIGLVLLCFIFWRAWSEEDLPGRAAPWIGKTLLVYLLVFSLGGSIYRDKFFWIALALAVKARSIAAATVEQGRKQGEK
ncbi:MAG: O-antigen ligase family protein, partial [Gemmatimonadota bacterium]|nr:O-antigen ligase family protein [Gemmatimonadota bacterium]